MDLHKYSIAEIEAELLRRKQRMGAPLPVPYPDFTALLDTITSGIAEYVETGQSKDFKQYVYEAAVEAVYGKEFWQWRNKQPW